jgi:AAA domain
VKDLPLLDELLSSTSTCSPPQLPFQLFDLIHKIKESGILGSHILAALGSRTKQLILLGDNRQLRPKVNNCRLSLEKGEGCDLNRSFFEKLVWEGFPHQILNEQHCMRPELSSLIRQLTYPALVDASKTLDRLDLRGFQDNVIFVNHTYPEEDIPQLAYQKDMSSSSKQNTFEADMVLKCARYLGQQGYGQENFVVLTPYLAQLHLLQDLLSRENELILNDHDFYDLGRAGLVPAVSAELSRRPIRIATIGKSHSSHYFISRSLHVLDTLHKS